MLIKKVFSFVLCLILIMSSAVFASAEKALPESEHNYADNAGLTWELELDNAPYGLYITFSEDTYFEPVDYSAFKTGDSLCVYTPSGDYLKSFTGDELAGAEVYVPDKSFKLFLTSDETVNAYGFKVTSVRAAEKDEIYTVRFHPCTDDTDDFSLKFSKRETAVSAYYSMYDVIYPSLYKEGWYLAGWAEENGGEICCDLSDSPAADMTELWARWIKLSLSQNEILPFSNGSDGFYIDGRNNYYLTEHDYFMLHYNLYRTFGVAPWPTPIVSAVYASYPFWKRNGSCYGMSVVTALQHYGYIDILSMQNVRSMAEIKPDKELISLINYYQVQQAADWPVENKLYLSGTPYFKAQLKNLYQSAASGNIVLFGAYSTNHSVLITAAYTNAEGEHVLVAYDNNIPLLYGRSNNYVSTYVISSDWSEIKYSGNKVSGIVWTDDFSHFESLDIGGRGSVLAWHRAFFSHIKTVFLVLRQIMSKAF